METPKDINGVRTELIMQNIHKEVFDGVLTASEYNQIYMIIYKSLRKISKRNLLRCMKELDYGLFER